MISLRKIIKEQTVVVVDVGERKPSETNEDVSSRPQNFGDICISALLKSQSQSEVLYALTRIQRDCSIDHNYSQYVPIVTSLFSQQLSKTLDYAVITTLERLAIVFPKYVARESFSAILQQLQKLPAVEYVACLIKLLPHVDSIKYSTIISQMLVFLKLSEDYQFAACLILEEMPFHQSYINNSIFTQFLQSPVLLSRFLAPITKKAFQLFGEKWLDTFLIPQLTTIANTKEYARAGAVRAILQNEKQFTERNSYSFLLSAFAWAQSSENVAVEVLENCDNILRNKKTEFGSKLKDFALKLQSAQDKTLRARVIKIVAEKPQILPTDNNVRSFVKNACKDSTPEVRCAFIENIVRLTQVFNTPEAKEQIFNFFVTFFNDPNESVRSLLTTTPYYSKIGNQKLTFLVPVIVRFSTAGLVSEVELKPPSSALVPSRNNLYTTTVNVSWRHFAACVRLFNSFPDPVVASGIQTMTNAVNQMTMKSPHALKDTCLNYYARVLYIAKPDQLEWLTTTITTFYGYSTIHALRSLFINISYTVCFCIKYEVLKDSVWNIVTTLAKDAVPSVRADFCSMLPRFLVFFRQQNDKEMENVVMDILNELSQDEDPYVKASWEKAQATISKTIVPDIFTSAICVSSNDIVDQDSASMFHSLPLLEKNKTKKTLKITPNMFANPAVKMGRIGKSPTAKSPLVLLPSSKRGPHRTSLNSPGRFI